MRFLIGVCFVVMCVYHVLFMLVVMCFCFWCSRLPHVLSKCVFVQCLLLCMLLCL